MYYCFLDMPIGELLLAGSNEALHLIGFPDGPKRRRPESDWINDEGPFRTAREQLLEYFCGQRRAFDLPLQLSGTAFQLAVFGELQRIPYGETRSYAAVAERIGRPKAYRAVGTANGCNPIPIIVPCHRVIGSDGGLAGFGGGVSAKQALLRLEAGYAL